MSVIKTEEDGWDCVPQLQYAIDTIDNLDNETYEIKYCTRESDLRDLVAALTSSLEEALRHLGDIDVDVEYETIEEE